MTNEDYELLTAMVALALLTLAILLYDIGDRYARHARMIYWLINLIAGLLVVSGSSLLARKVRQELRP